MNQIKEDDKFFNDLLYNVCSGKVSDMREMKRLDVFEFFDYLENAGSRTNNKRNK